jgi:cell wall-associated NlpC family hydrolase
VNLYHYYWMYGRALYRVSGLTDGPHTLTIRVLGEKDDRSTSFWVPFDGVEVVGTILQASPMSQETDWRLSWTGTWTNISNAAYSGGHIKRASAAGRMKATFTGTQGVVLASVGPSWGKARVRVDGGAAKTIDLYRSTASSRRSIFSTGSLPYGTHTITVEWTGARNAKATTTRINVDALKVAGIVTPHTSKAKARDTIVRTAIDQLGDKYVWAAVGPTTFDCSGLVLYCYRAAGISLPHYSGYQWDLCSPKNVPVSQLLPGDLVFTDSPSYIHHVGIYIGKGITINAPGSGRYVEYRDADTYGCAGRIKSSLWP